MFTWRNEPWLTQTSSMVWSRSSLWSEENAFFFWASLCCFCHLRQGLWSERGWGLGPKSGPGSGPGLRHGPEPRLGPLVGEDESLVFLLLDFLWAFLWTGGEVWVCGGLVWVWGECVWFVGMTPACSSLIGADSLSVILCADWLWLLPPSSWLAGWHDTSSELGRCSRVPSDQLSSSEKQTSSSSALGFGGEETDGRSAWDGLTKTRTTGKQVTPALVCLFNYPEWL